jgi:hypothetical protein
MYRFYFYSLFFILTQCSNKRLEKSTETKSDPTKNGSTEFTNTDSPDSLDLRLIFILNPKRNDNVNIDFLIEEYNRPVA